MRHLARCCVQGYHPIVFVRPESDQYVWGQQFCVVIMLPICVEKQDGVSEVLDCTCALLCDLDEFVAECFASQRSGGVGGGLRKKIMNILSDPRFSLGAENGKRNELCVCSSYACVHIVRPPRSRPEPYYMCVRRERERERENTRYFCIRYIGRRYSG